MSATSPVPLIESPFDRERLEDVGFMTCMTLTLLGNYQQTGHFGGPLAYTPFNVAAHLIGLTPNDRYLRFGYAATDAQISKYVHNFASFSFVLGLLLIISLFIKDNLPEIRIDLDWIKKGGGFLESKHASARRFNAGEKLVFWGGVFALGLVVQSLFHVTLMTVRSRYLRFAVLATS